MGISRRALLIAGGAAVIVAGAGGAWALTRTPKAALAPWRDAGDSFGDPRLDALAFAILAPNPHNMQPWRVALEGEDAFALSCDLRRTLPKTDPPNRQITIGFGCFLELFRQAAAEKGWRADFDYFPEGEPQPLLDQRPIARVRLVKDGGIERDPLFAHILSRRTNRAPFNVKRIPAGNALDAVRQASVDGVAAKATAATALVDDLRSLAADAWRTEWSLDRTRRESLDVTRIGKREINEKPWGLALEGPFMEGANDLGLLTREKMDRPGTTAYEQSLEFYNQACRTATAFLWSVTKTNTRRDQLEAGRAWARMQLAATKAGLAFHPLSQALQEFPEMRAHYARAHALLAPEGGTVQMLVRLGFAAKAPPAPRLPLKAHLVDA